jgi:hypothetical protein
MPDISNFINGFESLGRGVFTLIANFDTLFIIVFVCFWILFVAMFMALMSKMPLFNDSGKANAQGIVLALVLSSISVYGLFVYNKAGETATFIENALNAFGIYAWIMIALLFFLIIKFWVWKK